MVEYNKNRQVYNMSVENTCIHYFYVGISDEPEDITNKNNEYFFSEMD